MHRNLNVYESAARIVAGAVLLLLSFAVFVHPVAQLLVILAGIWIILEGICGCCPLYSSLGLNRVGFLKTETVLWLLVAGVQAVLGYVWWHAGWEKIIGGTYVHNLAHTFAGYAAGNPFMLVRGALLGPLATASVAIGYVTEFAEYFIGIAMVALSYVIVAAKTDSARRWSLRLSVVALAVGAVINALFYFAAAHTDKYLGMANVTMFWTQAVLVYGFIALALNKNGKR